MKNTDNTADLQLPESLCRKISHFENELRTMETIVAVLGGLCGVCFTYGVLFVSDRLWNTPIWLRLPLTLLGGLTMALFGCYWLHHWWWRRRDTMALTQIVQKRHKRLGDRLLGVVELTRSGELPKNVSPALCRAAIKQVAAEAETMDFDKAVSRRGQRKAITVFGILFLIVAVTFAAVPRASWNTLVRWFRPASQVQRYTFVQLEDMDANLVVAHGEEFEIACELAPGSRWKPVVASCRMEDQPRIDAEMERGTAVFPIPGQTSDGVLRIRIGDAVKDITVKPVFRPELQNLEARLSLPLYLQRSNVVQKIEGSRVEFIEGSVITFAGQASRELVVATLTRGEKTDTLDVRDQEFVSSGIKVSSLASCVFSWKDRYGLVGLSPRALEVVSVADATPFVECRGIGRAIAILADEIVKIKILTEDDFGIKEVWINWNSVGSKERGIHEVNGTHTVGTGTPQTTSLNGEFSFSPIMAQVPEETMVNLCAYASDYYPGRKPAMSQVFRIYVLSRAQHAKLIQQQMEALQARVEDLAREEERLLNRNEDLASASTNDLSSAKSTTKIKEGEASEKSNAARLEDVADEGEELLKEALRNKDISEETLRKWAEVFNKMKSVAKGEMGKASKALKSSANSSGQKREQKLKEAIASEKEALKALREMEQDVNKSLEDMLAKSFVNRLLTAAGWENEIATTLKESLPKTIGVASEDLPVDLAQSINLMAARQGNAMIESENIRDDLAGFYNRTHVKVYAEIHEEMRKAKISESMKALKELIERNVGMESIKGAMVWKEKLTAWAELLRKKSNCEGQAGEPGQKSIEEADLEVLIALMRARRREEGLREQTRLLEKSRESSRTYKADARRLSRLQAEIARDTRPLERKARHPKLQALVQKIGGEMMNARVFLQRPQTDSTTIAIETEIIELLSNSISESSGQCSSAMAQMMMQSMGLKPGMGSGAGAAGGGSMAGGTTDGANSANGGDGDGNSQGARSVDKTGGVDISRMPREFRNVFEAYYNALEQEK